MKNNNNLVIILLVVLALLFALPELLNLVGVESELGAFGYGFGWIFMVMAIVATVWVIYDVIANNKGLSDGMKILWIVCAILFSIITAIIYYLVGRDQRNDLFRKR